MGEPWEFEYLRSSQRWAARLLARVGFRFCIVASLWVLFVAVALPIHLGGGHDRVETNTRIIMLQTAIMGYKSTYGYLPCWEGRQRDVVLDEPERYDALIESLCGDNPRRIP
jgi:hypothetical protein